MTRALGGAHIPGSFLSGRKVPDASEQRSGGKVLCVHSSHQSRNHFLACKVSHGQLYAVDGECHG